MLLNIVLKVLT